MATPLVALAWPALASPYIYQPSYEVHIQLNEPLWTLTSGPKVIAMEIMGLCVQLEAILLQSNEREMVGGGKKVWFERGSSHQSNVLLGHMRDTLDKAGETRALESYLRESGIGYLFPRVELYLQEPEQELTSVDSPIMDSYWSHLSSLHNVSTLTTLIQTDLTSSPSHKYIAHTAALLYQALSCVPHTMAHFKREIEDKFSDLKCACSPGPTGHPPRLPPHLHSWFLDYNARLKAMTCDPMCHISPQVAQVLDITQYKH